MITRAHLARLATATGPELACLLANTVGWLDELTDAERLEVVKASARLDAWTATVRARAIGAVYDSAEAEIAADSAEFAAAAARSNGGEGGDGDARCRLAGPSHGYDDLRLAHRRLGAEVSLALGVSTWVADREVDLALDLRARPHLMQALADGVLDRAQAAVIVDGANALTDPVNEVRLLTSLLGPDDSPDGDDCGFPGGSSGGSGGSGGLGLAAVAADPDADPAAFWALMQACQAASVRELTRPGSQLWGIPANRLRTILRREVARLEPAAAAERARAARSDRRVVFDDQPDFMSELHVRSTTDAAAAAYANIDQTARAARLAGDRRTLDQLRADISIGWLTEGAFGTLVTRPAPIAADTTSEGGSGEPAPGERGSGLDGSGLDGSGLDGSGLDGSGPDGSGPDGSGPDGSGAGAPREERATGSICLPHRLGALINLTVAATTATGLDDERLCCTGRPDRSRSRPSWPESWRTVRGPRAGAGSCTTQGPASRVMSLRVTERRRALMASSAPGMVSGRACRPAWRTHLELDHVREFDHARPAAGGQTRAANLASLGQRDHHLKTDRVLRISGDANAELSITTPSGRCYVSEPHRYADPQDDLSPPAYIDPPF